MVAYNKAMERKQNIPLVIMTPLILVFLVGYQYWFGGENVVVGVVFCIALIVLNVLGAYEHPLRYGAGMLAVALLIAVATTVAHLNIYMLGAVTLITLFCSVYFLFGDFHAILYLPVNLGFLYILAIPSPTERISYRIAALVTGALVGTAVLWVLRRIHKVTSLPIELSSLVTSIAQRTLLLAGAYDADIEPEPTAHLLARISSVNTRLYHQPLHARSLDEVTEMRISVVLTLERLVTALAKLRSDHALTPFERQCLAKLAGLLERIGESSGDLKRWHEILPEITSFLREYKHTDEPSGTAISPELYEVVSAFDVLSYQVGTIRKLRALDDVSDISVQKASWARELYTVARPKNLRLSFALKYSITLSVLVIASNFIPLTHSYWLYWTAAILIKPFAEDTTDRARKRVIATLIGVILFGALFGFISDTTLLLTIAIALELLSFQLPFNTIPQIVAATAGSLSIIALATHQIGDPTVERISLVLAGVLIALIVTRYIFPYRIAQTSAQLIARSLRLSLELAAHVLEVRIRFEKSDSYEQLNRATMHDIKGVSLALSSIEHQIELNNRIKKLPSVTQFVMNQHKLVNNIYFFYATYRGLGYDDELVLSFMTQLLDIVRNVSSTLSTQIIVSMHIDHEHFEPVSNFSQELKKLNAELDAAFAYSLSNAQRLAVDSLSTVVSGLMTALTLISADQGSEQS